MPYRFAQVERILNNCGALLVRPDIAAALAECQNMAARADAALAILELKHRQDQDYEAILQKIHAGFSVNSFSPAVRQFAVRRNELAQTQMMFANAVWLVAEGLPLDQILAIEAREWNKGWMADGRGGACVFAFSYGEIHHHREALSAFVLEVERASRTAQKLQSGAKIASAA